MRLRRKLQGARRVRYRDTVLQRQHEDTAVRGSEGAAEEVNAQEMKEREGEPDEGPSYRYNRSGNNKTCE